WIVVLEADRLLQERLLQRRGRGQRGAGCGLLRLLLRPSAAARQPRAVEQHLDLVGARVIGTAHRQHLVLRRAPPALQELLQLGLRIVAQRLGLLEERQEHALDRFPGALHAAGEEDGGDDRFERVGQPPRALPTARALPAAAELAPPP